LCLAIGLKRTILMGKPKVLVMVDWFEPGFKAGGPIRSAVNFVYQLKEELDIYVLTSDRDLGDVKPYPGINTDQWTSKDGYSIFYAQPASLNWKFIGAQIKKINPSAIYLNSMFSLYFTIYPLLMKKSRMVSSSIVLAPRGMLRESALSYKNSKKKIFINVFRILGIQKLIRFHATDQTEVNDIRKNFGEGMQIELMANLPGSQKEFIAPPYKYKGQLSIVFIGRIHPIKNLDYLLARLSNIEENVSLTAIAPVEDKFYWEKCNQMIRQMPSNISVTHLGDVPHHEIANIIRENHIFALPTSGENFGHSIFEALSNGRPVIISDQTPWKGLKGNMAGMDISLKNEEQFEEALSRFAKMDNDEFMTWCTSSWKFCHDFIEKTNLKPQYLKIFS